MAKRVSIPRRDLEFYDLDATRRQLAERIAKTYHVMLRTAIALLHLVDWDESVAQQCLASGTSATTIELAFELLDREYVVH
jgi:hypothetical protein